MNYLKVNRTFTITKKYSWIFIILVAFGGLWFNKLGLLGIPLMLSVIISGLMKKKYWCGNICPYGSWFDYALYPLTANRKIGKFFKSKFITWTMFSFFMFMMGFRFIKVFSSPASDIWDKIGIVFVTNFLMVTSIGTILALTVNTRAWCSFCPMGTLQEIMYNVGRKIGLNKKADSKITAISGIDCVTCKKCEKVCPMQIPVHEDIKKKGYVSDPKCINCKVCTHNCPLKMLKAS